MSRYAGHQSSSVRRSQWTHLRQLSRTSLDRLASESPRSPDTVSSNSTVRLDSLRAGSRDDSQAKAPHKCTVTVNESFARDEILLNLDLFDGDLRAGMLVSIDILGPEASKQLSTAAKRLDPTSSHGAPDEAVKRYLFVVKDMPKDLKARFPHVEIYVAKHIADAFGMKKGSQVLLAPVDESNPAVEASHVELTFKDQYLSRADMWRIAVGELADRSVYQGQMMYFMGTVKTQVSAVFVDGRKVHSAFFSKHTKPIFRSESARYVLFIQMAREMWEFDSDDSGDIMFDKVVNGFLPALFKKWADLKVKHLVTVVLFARVEYDTGITAELGNATFQNDYYTGIQTSGDKRPYKDFYRVVVSEMTSGEWTTILYQLRKEFNYFRRDISVHHLKAMDSIPNLSEEPGSKTGSTTRIKAESSRAIYGNILEAINLASSLFAHDYIDRDLMRTGISVAVITPGSGVFEVDYETLRRTTEALVGNGIGIDLICVPKIPLHSVPIFRYRNPARVDGHGSKSKPSFSYGSTPKAPTPLGTSYQSLTGSFSPNRGSDVTRRSDAFAMRHNDEWCFAIPQWLHVSYWSGRSDNTLSFEGIALSVADHPKQSLDDFAIRCRMYELQMKSVLEMNEIETMPLHQDPFFPTSVWQNSLSQKTRLHDLREIASIPAQKIHDPLHDNVLGFQKALADRHSKPGEKSMWKQLQEFDDARVKLQVSRRRHLPPRAARDPDDGARHHGDDTTIYGTSASDRRSSFSSSAVAINSALSRRKNQDGSGPFTHSRKSSDSTTAENPKVSSLKVPKFLRQISLGHRGFGIAAPQAAVAQVQAEHVSAVKETAPATPNPGASKQVPAIQPKRPITPQSMISNGSTPAKEIGRSSAFGLSKELKSETPSRPMFIKSAQPSMDKVPQTLNESLAATLRPSTMYRSENPEQKLSNLLRRADITEDDDAHRNKLLAGAVPELPAMLSPTTAMSPWLTVINPSNPEVEKVDMTRLYSRWQHVFVRPSAMKVMKWKSLCSPAAVPLTTEYFPSKEQFDREYQRQPYQIEQDEDDDIPEEPRSREEFLRELISLRFSQGFQVVIGPAVARAFGQKHIKVGDIFSRDRQIEDGTSVFMAVGNTIHQLACVNGTEVEVTIYVRKPTEPTGQSDSLGAIYKPAIRTLLDRQYRTVEIDVVTPKADRNWNFIDSFVAGHYDEMSDENMRFWRARYVLIPINSSKDLSNPKFADNDEEIRIEGIRYIAEQWLRHRYVPPSERRFQPQGHRRARDPNPLDIIYKTEDPSVVIAAELETLPLLEGLEPGTKRSQLVTSRDQFKKSNFKIAALAEAMQQPVEEGGVRLQNRRWHLRLHYNCFIGSDMTSWLLDNFEDLESRAEAEALGNSLMVDKTREEEEPGLFVHVEKRHQFRDGQYFYQISSDYAKPQPPSWFNSARRNLVSIPPTPRTENTPRDSPQPPPSFTRPMSTHDEDSSASSATTPTIPIGTNTRRPRVVLSKVMKYDVDHRKRSYRPERIDLHYDRLHNPDNCYHVRIEWMNTTPKLIQDTIEGWARDMTRFGLRLVEVPIAEVHKIGDINPFRAPYPVNLALPPPDRQPIAYYDPNSFAATTQPRKHFYQKAILRKMDFVLDMEAATDFPSNVEVTYSWGKPDYKYPQYIHRSGTVLAQISDEGNFFLLGNRMHTSRSVMAARERELRNEQQTAIDRRNGGGTLGGSAAANTLASHGGFAPTPTSSPMVRPAMYASPVIRAASMLPPPPTSVPSMASAAATAAAPMSSSLGMGGMGSSDGPTPAPSRGPAIEPASVGGESWMVKDQLEQFCYNKSALEAFYREMLEQAQLLASGSSRLKPTIITTPGMGPVGPVADVNIPVIGLPPGLLGQHNNHNHPHPHPHQYQTQSEDSLSGSVRTASPGPIPGPAAQRTSSPGIAMTAARLLRRGSIQRN